MITLRPYKSADLNSLYEISLATGYAGGDATGLYQDPRMIGHIYSAPYALLSPATSFVAEDADGVGGYVVGVTNTRAFENQLEREWWPKLRAVYADPNGTPASGWNADQRRGYMIHHPFRTPDAVVGAYPAHLHMNLVPRMQGQGVGKLLLERWLGEVSAPNAAGVHVGVSAHNPRGVRFWESCGFERLERNPSANSAIWLGRYRGAPSLIKGATSAFGG